MSKVGQGRYPTVASVIHVIRHNVAGNATVQQASRRLEKRRASRNEQTGSEGVAGGLSHMALGSFLTAR